MMRGVSGVGLLECKTPPEFNQTEFAPNPTTAVIFIRVFAEVCRWLIKPIDCSPAMLLSCVASCVNTVSPAQSQMELDQEKGLEIRKKLLSRILDSEKTYLNELDTILIVSISHDIHQEGVHSTVV